MIRSTIALLQGFVVKVKLLSRFRLFATPGTVARQAPPSKGFSRQEYWSGLPFPSPGDLPEPGIQPGAPALQAMLYPLSHQFTVATKLKSSEAATCSFSNRA